MEKSELKSFGPIGEANINFGDLTLLIATQASGKSILLQLIKLIIDRYNIQSVLKQNNYEWGNKTENFLDLFFVESMSSVWKPDTKIIFDKKEYFIKSFFTKQGVRESSRTEKLFYIPAQRVVTMSQGWPKAFRTFDIGDPFVLKQFGESIRVLMEKETMNGDSADNNVFPKQNRIKEPIRKILDENIFHGAKVESDNTSLKRRFLLRVGESKLPFMTWSAGQKEFMPLFHNERNKVELNDSKKCGGSLFIDQCLLNQKLYPNDNRWDYAIDYNGEVFFFEVHKASSGEVSTVLKKFQWLKDWLAQKAPEINALKAKSKTPYYWVQSNGFHILPNSSCERAVREKGLKPISKLVLK